MTRGRPRNNEPDESPNPFEEIIKRLEEMRRDEPPNPCPIIGWRRDVPDLVKRDDTPYWLRMMRFGWTNDDE